MQVEERIEIRDCLGGFDMETACIPIFLDTAAHIITPIPLKSVSGSDVSFVVVIASAKPSQQPRRLNSFEAPGLAITIIHATFSYPSSPVAETVLNPEIILALLDLQK